jgi:hypothetical protein
MEQSANKTMQEKLSTATLDAIVKGESQEKLLSALRSRCDEQTAQQILSDANKKYEALKTNGSLADYEYNLYFDRAKNRTSKRDIAGLSLILLGVGATAFSYLSAAPGERYFIFSV